MAKQANRAVWGLAAVQLVASTLCSGLDRSAHARDGGHKQSGQPFIQAYGPWGRLPTSGDHWSPDGRYVARARVGLGESISLSIIHRRSGRRLARAFDVSGLLWLPRNPHRLVVATCGVYGRASLRLWEGGTRWRSLHRVRYPADECFGLYGATRDGRWIIYSHADLDKVEALKRRRWLRLPPRSARSAPVDTQRFPQPCCPAALNRGHCQTAEERQEVHADQ
jgi:hypothetical protein